MQTAKALAIICAVVVIANCVGEGNSRDFAITPRVTRLLNLEGQLVFAYSRVSGDGRRLVYSSEPDTGKAAVHSNQTLRVIDFETSRSLFEARGIDGYWSPDGKHVIYRSISEKGDHVNIWNRDTAEITNDVLPINLGDYYSWGNADGVDTLLTILGWFVSIQDDGKKSKPQQMPKCNEIGRGARPLLSRDGQRVSVFVSDEIVLRDLRDCSNIVRTGLVGAKADWSRDGRYLAFHTPKQRDVGYDIGILDTKESIFRRISLPGSSFFPSWTDTNALVFRYDGPDYDGFIRADDVFASAASSFAAPTYLTDRSEIRRQWRRLVPQVGSAVVLLWASWSAHTSEALTSFANANLDCGSNQCARIAAYDPSSAPGDIARFRDNSSRFPFDLIEAPWSAVRASGGVNQSPTYLLFVDGRLANRSLGAMSAGELDFWLASNFTH